MGHQFDFKTCQQKIRNLKKSYKLVINNNRKTGRGRKTCKYFDKLDSIFGKRPSFRPSVTEEIGTGECSSPKCSKKMINQERIREVQQQQFLKKENPK